MKRRLTKLVVFLLLGAILNVAVAWGCAIWSPIADIPSVKASEFTPRDGELPFPQDWLALPDNGNARLVRYGSRSHGIGFRSINNSWSNAWLGVHKMFPDVALYEHVAGWPFRSMRCDGYFRFMRYAESYERRNTLTWSGGIRAPRILSPRSMQQLGVFTHPRPLPLRPTWPGFAINTVFYAAILWLLTLGPFTARRIIRCKRGLCINCGYDLPGASGGGGGGGGVCPECGASGR